MPTSIDSMYILYFATKLNRLEALACVQGDAIFYFLKKLLIMYITVRLLLLSVSSLHDGIFVSPCITLSVHCTCARWNSLYIVDALCSHWWVYWRSHNKTCVFATVFEINVMHLNYCHHHAWRTSSTVFGKNWRQQYSGGAMYRLGGFSSQNVA